MFLTVLGNGSGGAFQGRNYTSHFLRIDKFLFLIDCGEGTQQQAYRFNVPILRVQQIFISHLHGDHVFGLVGLLTSMSLSKRTKPLQIFAPAGLDELIAVHQKICSMRLSFDLEICPVPTDTSTVVFENKRLEVRTIPLLHRTATTGWLFAEKTQPRHLIAEAIEQYNIPYHKRNDIKNGADWVLPDGTVIPNERLTTDAKPSKSYAFCSDTAFHPPIAQVVQGVDLLYHEATHIARHRALALASFHSTAADAARIAQLAGAKRLLLGHFSNRYNDLSGHLKEAQEVFAATELAIEGETIAI